MNFVICLLKFRWPGNASSPSFGKPRCTPSVTPGPYSSTEVSKPLRCRRVACSRLTRPIEPSNATVWNVTSAFSPGRGLHVLEDLLFVIDQEIARLMRLGFDFRHEHSSELALIIQSLRRAQGTPVRLACQPSNRARISISRQLPGRGFTPDETRNFPRVTSSCDLAHQFSRVAAFAEFRRVSTSAEGGMHVPVAHDAPASTTRGLKIHVSAVQFRPRTPDSSRKSQVRTVSPVSLERLIPSSLLQMRYRRRSDPGPLARHG